MKPTGLNEKIIRQWKQDLLDKGVGPRFNIDYPVIEHEGRPGDATRFEGDPGFFLAWHFAIDNGEVEDDTKLSEWLAKRTTEEMITRYTGIPLDVAKQLVEPEALWKVNFPTRTLTPKQFVAVLDKYLETGHVLWETIILDQPEFTVLNEDVN